MNWPLHAIERSCRRVPGGLKRLLIVDPNDLTAQPAWNTIPSVDALSFDAGKAAYLFEQDTLRGQLVCDTDISNDAGDIFNYTLTAQFRNIRPEMEFLLAKLRNRRVHVLATYQDNLRRFLPNMRLRGKSDSGTAKGRNGYSITGTCQLDQPAPFLETDVNVVYPDGVTITTPDSLYGVTIVTATTSDADYAYTVPAGKWLVGVYVRSNAAQTVSLGLSAGEEDLGGTLSADAGIPILFQGNNLRPLTPTPIYLSGLSGSNSIEIWLLG